MLTLNDLAQIEQLMIRVLSVHNSKVFQDEKIYSLKDEEVQKAIGVFGVKHGTVSAIRKLEKKGIAVAKTQRVGSTIKGSDLNKYLSKAL